MTPDPRPLRFWRFLLLGGLSVPLSFVALGLIAMMSLGQWASSFFDRRLTPWIEWLEANIHAD